jgi:hypothetical protein
MVLLDEVLIGRGERERGEKIEKSGFFLNFLKI